MGVSDPSLDGLKSLMPNRQPYKYPLRVRVFLWLSVSLFPLPKREREREPNLPSYHYSHFGMPKSWLESSGGRSWVYETFKLFLLYIELIWEHPDPSMYEYNIFRSIVN